MRQRTAHQKGNRNTVVEDIRLMMSVNFAGSDMTAACLYWAKASAIRMREAGHRSLLQAGTAYWTRVPPDLDDGVCSTEFGYEWDADSSTNLKQIMAGQMPEMHVWVALPDRNQIVDLTTGFQPDRCKEITGLDWLADRPPDWLWMDCEKLAERGCFYAPCRKATLLAYQMLQVSKWGE